MPSRLSYNPEQPITGNPSHAVETNILTLSFHVRGVRKLSYSYVPCDQLHFLSSREAYTWSYIDLKEKPARTNDNAYLLLSGASPPEVSLLRYRQFSTLTLRQGYPRLSTLADDKNVGDAIIANS